MDPDSNIETVEPEVLNPYDIPEIEALQNDYSDEYHRILSEAVALEKEFFESQPTPNRYAELAYTKRPIWALPGQMTYTSAAIEHGIIQRKRFAEGWDLWRAGASDEEIQIATKPYRDALEGLNLQTDSWWGGAYVGATEMLPLMVEGWTEGAKMGALWAGIAAPTAAAVTAWSGPGALAAAGVAGWSAGWAGFHAGTIMYWMRVGTAEIYMNLRANTDMETRDAQWSSAILGIPYGLIEYSQFLLATKGFRMLSNAALTRMSLAAVEGSAKRASFQFVAGRAPKTPAHLRKLAETRPWMAASIQNVEWYAMGVGWQTFEEGLQRAIVVGSEEWANAEGRKDIAPAIDRVISESWLEMMHAFPAIMVLQMPGQVAMQYAFSMENGLQFQAGQYEEYFEEDVDGNTNLLGAISAYSDPATVRYQLRTGPIDTIAKQLFIFMNRGRGPKYLRSEGFNNDYNRWFTTMRTRYQVLLDSGDLSRTNRVISAVTSRVTELKKERDAINSILDAESLEAEETQEQGLLDRRAEIDTEIAELEKAKPAVGEKAEPVIMEAEGELVHEATSKSGKLSKIWKTGDGTWRKRVLNKDGSVLRDETIKVVYWKDDEGKIYKHVYSFSDGKLVSHQASIVHVIGQKGVEQPEAWKAVFGAPEQGVAGTESGLMGETVEEDLIAGKSGARDYHTGELAPPDGEIISPEEAAKEIAGEEETADQIIEPETERTSETPVTPPSFEEWLRQNFITSFEKHLEELGIITFNQILMQYLIDVQKPLKPGEIAAYISAWIRDKVKGFKNVEAEEDLAPKHRKVGITNIQKILDNFEGTTVTDEHGSPKVVFRISGGWGMPGNLHSLATFLGHRFTSADNAIAESIANKGDLKKYLSEKATEVADEHIKKHGRKFFQSDKIYRSLAEIQEGYNKKEISDREIDELVRDISQLIDNHVLLLKDYSGYQALQGFFLDVKNPIIINSRKKLRDGFKEGDIDLIEIEEAFNAQGLLENKSFKQRWVNLLSTITDGDGVIKTAGLIVGRGPGRNIQAIIKLTTNLIDDKGNQFDGFKILRRRNVPNATAEDILGMTDKEFMEEYEVEYDVIPFSDEQIQPILSMEYGRNGFVLPDDIHAVLNHENKVVNQRFKHGGHYSGKGLFKQAKPLKEGGKKRTLLGSNAWYFNASKENAEDDRLQALTKKNKAQITEFDVTLDNPLIIRTSDMIEFFGGKEPDFDNVRAYVLRQLGMFSVYSKALAFVTADYDKASDLITITAKKLGYDGIALTEGTGEAERLNQVSVFKKSSFRLVDTTKDTRSGIMSFNQEESKLSKIKELWADFSDPIVSMITKAKWLDLTKDEAIEYFNSTKPLQDFYDAKGLWGFLEFYFSEYRTYEEASHEYQTNPSHFELPPYHPPMDNSVAPSDSLTGAATRFTVAYEYPTLLDTPVSPEFITKQDILDIINGMDTPKFRLFGPLAKNIKTEKDTSKDIQLKVEHTNDGFFGYVSSTVGMWFYNMTDSSKPNVSSAQNLLSDDRVYMALREARDRVDGWKRIFIGHRGKDSADVRTYDAPRKADGLIVDNTFNTLNALAANLKSNRQINEDTTGPEVDNRPYLSHTVSKEDGNQTTIHHAIYDLVGRSDQPLQIEETENLQEPGPQREANDFTVFNYHALQESENNTPTTESMEYVDRDGNPVSIPRRTLFEFIKNLIIDSGYNAPELTIADHLLREMVHAFGYFLHDSHSEYVYNGDIYARRNLSAEEQLAAEQLGDPYTMYDFIPNPNQVGADYDMKGRKKRRRKWGSVAFGRREVLGEDEEWRRRDQEQEAYGEPPLRSRQSWLDVVRNNTGATNALKHSHFIERVLTEIDGLKFATRKDIAEAYVEFVQDYMAIHDLNSKSVEFKVEFKAKVKDSTFSEVGIHKASAENTELDKDFLSLVSEKPKPLKGTPDVFERIKIKRIVEFNTAKEALIKKASASKAAYNSKVAEWTKTILANKDILKPKGGLDIANTTFDTDGYDKILTLWYNDMQQGEDNHAHHLLIFQNNDGSNKVHDLKSFIKMMNSKEGRKQSWEGSASRGKNKWESLNYEHNVAIQENLHQMYLTQDNLSAGERLVETQEHYFERISKGSYTITSRKLWRLASDVNSILLWEHDTKQRDNLERETTASDKEKIAGLFLSWKSDIIFIPSYLLKKKSSARKVKYGPTLPSRKISNGVDSAAFENDHSRGGKFDLYLWDIESVDKGREDLKEKMDSTLEEWTEWYKKVESKSNGNITGVVTKIENIASYVDEAKLAEALTGEVAERLEQSLTDSLITHHNYYEASSQKEDLVAGEIPTNEVIDEELTWATFFVDGGQNRRAMAIHLTTGAMYSHHGFPENTIAHARWDTRIINGLRYLYLQELQSNWVASVEKKGGQQQSMGYRHNWVELAMRHLLSYAKEHDFDGIVWNNKPDQVALLQQWGNGAPLQAHQLKSKAPIIQIYKTRIGRALKYINQNFTIKDIDILEADNLKDRASLESQFKALGTDGVMNSISFTPETKREIPDKEKFSRKPTITPESANRYKIQFGKRVYYIERLPPPNSADLLKLGKEGLEDTWSIVSSKKQDVHWSEFEKTEAELAIEKATRLGDEQVREDKGTRDPEVAPKILPSSKKTGTLTVKETIGSPAVQHQVTFDPDLDDYKNSTWSTTVDGKEIVSSSLEDLTNQLTEEESEVLSSGYESREAALGYLVKGVDLETIKNIDNYSPRTQNAIFRGNVGLRDGELTLISGLPLDRDNVNSEMGWIQKTLVSEDQFKKIFGHKHGEILYRDYKNGISTKRVDLQLALAEKVGNQEKIQQLINVPEYASRHIDFIFNLAFSEASFMNYFNTMLMERREAILEKYEFEDLPSYRINTLLTDDPLPSKFQSTIEKLRDSSGNTFENAEIILKGYLEIERALEDLQDIGWLLAGHKEYRTERDDEAVGDVDVFRDTYEGAKLGDKFVGEKDALVTRETMTVADMIQYSTAKDLWAKAVINYSEQPKRVLELLQKNLKRGNTRSTTPGPRQIQTGNNDSAATHADIVEYTDDKNETYLIAVRNVDGMDIAFYRKKDTAENNWEAFFGIHPNTGNINKTARGDKSFGIIGIREAAKELYNLEAPKASVIIAVEAGTRETSHGLLSINRLLQEITYKEEDESKSIRAYGREGVNKKAITQKELVIFTVLQRNKESSRHGSAIPESDQIRGTTTLVRAETGDVYKHYIQIFKTGELDTIFHEEGHFIFSTFTAEEISTLALLTGVEESLINAYIDMFTFPGARDISDEEFAEIKKVQEIFARNIEAYFRTGKTDIESMKPLMNSAKREMSRIYKNVKDIPDIQRAQPEEVRLFFDMLFMTKQDKEIRLQNIRDQINSNADIDEIIPALNEVVRLLNEDIGLDPTVQDALYDEISSYRDTPTTRKKDLTDLVQSLENEVDKIRRKEYIKGILFAITKLGYGDKARADIREEYKALSDKIVNAVQPRFIPKQKPQEKKKVRGAKEQPEVEKPTPVTPLLSKIIINDILSKTEHMEQTHSGYLEILDNLATRFEINELTTEELSIMNTALNIRSGLAPDDGGVVGVQRKLDKEKQRKRILKAKVYADESAKEAGASWALSDKEDEGATTVGEVRTNAFGKAIAATKHGFEGFMKPFKTFFGVSSLNMETIVEVLAGKQGHSTIKQILFKNFDIKRKQANKFKQEVTDLYHSKIAGDSGDRLEVQELIAKSSFRGDKKVIPLPTSKLRKSRSITLTAGERIAFMAQADVLNNYNAITKYGMVIEGKEDDVILLDAHDVKWLYEHLKQADSEGAEYRVAEIMYALYNTKFKEAMNEVNENVQGVDFPELAANFWPLRQVRKREKYKQTEGVTSPNLNALYRNTRIGVGINLEKNVTTTPLVLRDAYVEFISTRDQVGAYIELAESLQEAKDLRLNENFAAVIKARFGQHWLDAIDHYINDLEGQSSVFQEPIEGFFHATINNVAVAILGANLFVSMKQFVSVIGASTEISWKYLAGPIGVATKENKALMSKYSPDMWERFQGFVDKEMGETAKESIAKASILRTTSLKQRYMAPITWMDSNAMWHLWKAVEREVKDLQPGLEKDAFYTAVAERHSEIVRKTQPTFALMNRSKIGRDRSLFWRLSVIFSSQRNKNFNMIYRAQHKFNNSERTQQDYIELSNAYTTIFIVEGLALHGINALRSAVDEDESDEEKRIAEEAIFSMLRTAAGYFYLTNMLSDQSINIFEEDATRHEYNAPATGVLLNLVRELKTYMRVRMSDEEITEEDITKQNKALFGVLKESAILSGHPAGNVAFNARMFGKIASFLGAEIPALGIEAHKFKSKSSQRPLVATEEIIENDNDTESIQRAVPSGQNTGQQY